MFCFKDYGCDIGVLQNSADNFIVGYDRFDDKEISVKIHISMHRKIVIDNEDMNMEYSLKADNVDFRPFGINAVLKNSKGDEIEQGEANCRFSTLDEAVNVMAMCLKENVLPYTVRDVLE